MSQTLSPTTVAGGEDDCRNLPHLRRLLHRAISFAPCRDDFGNDRDADFGRTRGADGKPDGAMDLCELASKKPAARIRSRRRAWVILEPSAPI